MQKIPFGQPILGDEEKRAVCEVMESGILVHGPKIHEFEEAFAKFTAAPHAVGVSNCTAGLHLVYFYLGIQAGDEVIVPAQTHTATAHAVELTGATPIFVDAERQTGNIDIDQIECAITSRTRAISLVHYLGMPVDMDRINTIAKKHNLYVIEDCALAIGSYYKGKHCGVFGDAGCFSFYPVKHMTTSEGGMVTARDEKIAKGVTRQRAFGMDRHVHERKVPGMYDVEGLGFNYRMSEINAALGIEQLKRVPEFLRRRKENYDHLTTRLQEISEVDLLTSTHGEFQSSYYCQAVILKPAVTKRRFDIMDAMGKVGVGTSIYYPHPVPHMSYYRNKYNITPTQFPNASWISDNCIALSVGPHLGTKEMDVIANSLKQALVTCR